MQKVRFWTRRFLELAIIGYVVCIVFIAGADAMHKPIIADRVQQAVHTK